MNKRDRATMLKLKTQISKDFTAKFTAGAKEHEHERTLDDLTDKELIKETWNEVLDMVAYVGLIISRLK